MSVIDRVTALLEGSAEERLDLTETQADDIRVCLQAYANLPPIFRALIKALQAASASGIMGYEILDLTGKADAVLRKTERTYG